MRKIGLGLAGVAGLTASLMSGTALAIPIVAFGQSGGANTMTATNNGAGATTLAIAAAPITVTQFDVGGTPFAATLTLNATSTDAAVNNAGVLTQHFSGTFSILSAVAGACGGVGGNCLSSVGNFQDVLNGNIGTNALTLGVGTPPSNALVFSSAVIPAGDLGIERALSFGFTNLSAPVGITAGSLTSTTGTTSGNASANIVSTTTTPAPEPTSLALLGSALVGVALMRRRRNAA